MLYKIWIIGDSFLSESWPTFVAQKTAATSKQRTLPFLFENFNLSPYFPGVGSNTRITIARIHNQFIEALNDVQQQLPLYIIVVPGLNIIEGANHGGPGGKCILEKCLLWLIGAMNSALSTRKEDLKSKRAGALFPSEHPAFIWVKSILQPFIKDMPKGFIFGQCGCFNDTLEHMAAKFPSHSTVDLDITQDQDMFDLAGCLSATSTSRFWKELNREVCIKFKADFKEKSPNHHQSSTPDFQFNRTFRQDPEVQSYHTSSCSFNRLSLEKSYYQFNCNY